MPSNRAYDSGRPLVFVHIPKTSGTSLNDALFAACPDQSPMTAWDRSMFGDFSDFASMDPGIVAYIFASPDDLPDGIGVFTGHIAYSSFQHKYSNAQFITVMREPIARLLSLWLFWRSKTDQELEPWGSYGQRVIEARKSLAQFIAVRSVACQVDNVALRLLLWPHPLIPDGGFIEPKDDAELLGLALRRLDSFSFVGILENAFHAQLGEWLGRPLVERKLNVTAANDMEHRRVLYQDLDAETYELLIQRCRLDRELWMSIATRRLSYAGALSVRERSLMTSIARFALLS